MMMERASKFIKGQVWVWEDPIYGAKENGREIDIGESTLRYSRYVIIFQNEESINKSILVVPCSSHNSSRYDVMIPLNHMYHNSMSYAKVSSIFPVHARFLQRYICTLPAVVIQKIESRIFHIFFPHLRSENNARRVKDVLGLDISDFDQPEVESEEYTFQQCVHDFIKSHILRTKNSSDVISLHDMKFAFKKYCTKHSIQQSHDFIEFLDTFFFLTSNAGSSLSYENRYKITQWESMKLHMIDYDTMPVLEEEVIEEETTVELPVVRGRRGKPFWTDDLKINFLRSYYNAGSPSIAAKEFNLKESTAIHYFYKWSKKIPMEKWLDCDNKITEKEDDIPEPINATPEIPEMPNTNTIIKSITKMSICIRKTLQGCSLYEELQDYHYDNSFNLNEEEWYSKLGKCIFYSLRQYLGIRDHNNQIIVPPISRTSSTFDSWVFFDKIYNDQRLSHFGTGTDIIYNYRKIFGKNTGIQKEWLNLLAPTLRRSKNININREGIYIICDKILSIFCTHNEIVK
jgi:hypothetical protein